MTREEAIEWMVFQKEQVLAMSGDKPSTLTVAYDMAIEALQAEPVKHGEWITNKLGLFECTACNTMLFTKQKDWSFCPYCGAKMKGQEE